MQSRPIAELFKENDIPHIVLGHDTFWDRKIVRIVLHSGLLFTLRRYGLQQLHFPIAQLPLFSYILYIFLLQLICLK
jgi:hypothetical protein